MISATAAAAAGPGARPRLIVVDDDDTVRRSLQLMLHWRGFDVRSFASAAPVLDDPGVDDTGLIVVDHRLPDRDGVALLAALRTRGWRGRAVMITGFPSAGLAAAARREGCDIVLEKPVRSLDLMIALGGPMGSLP
jgi:FixJ family two-component response regulator